MKLRLDKEGNVSYVLPAYSEIFRFIELKATGSSVKLLHQYNLGVNIDIYKRIIE